MRAAQSNPSELAASGLFLIVINGDETGDKKAITKLPSSQSLGKESDKVSLPLLLRLFILLRKRRSRPSVILDSKESFKVFQRGDAFLKDSRKEKKNAQ